MKENIVQKSAKKSPQALPEVRLRGINVRKKNKEKAKKPCAPGGG
jgi:hypothetical protein